MDVSTEHIEIVEGAGGPKPRILGHRIRVVDVVGWYEKQDMSVPEILEEFPTITAADVHAALAYHWDHKDELDHKMADDDAFAEEMRRTSSSPLQAKLKQLGVVERQVPVRRAYGTHVSARELRKQGIDVVTATDTGLRATPDEAQLAHAHATGRVMVAQDRDFTRLARVGQPHSGIAYCQHGRGPLARSSGLWSRFTRFCEDDEIVGRVEYL